MAGYLGASPVPQSIQKKESFTATASQTTFNTTGYTDGNFINVYLNGVRLINGTDYTATNGSDIVLTSAASASDVLDFETFNEFTLVDQDLTTPTLTGATLKSNVTLKNDTEEDTDGGRESTLIFKGEQSGGEISTLAQIQASHDGTSDDQKGDLIFKTNDGSDNDAPTERMRIDSSGLVGVNTTPEGWSSLTGIDVGQSAGFHGHASDEAAYVSNNLYFDGSNWKAKNTDESQLILLTSTSGANHIGFYANASVSADANVTLDEHLRIDSDGLKFNGDTATANALSDYEEGTWTPAYEFTGGGTVTNGTRGGNYVKVGNLVLIGFNIRSTGVSGVSGFLQISGLPFAIKNATGARMGGSVGFNRDWGADMPNFRIYTVPNTSVLYFYYNAMNTGSSQLGTSQFATGSDHNVIEASVAYITE